MVATVVATINQCAAAALLYAAAYAITAPAQEIWQFVDGNGVLHIGNAAPKKQQQKSQRTLIWLNQVPLARHLVSPPANRTPRVALARLEQVRPWLEAAAHAAQLEPALVLAVAAVESAFDADAVSHKGARGLMQLMPATAARYGITDPQALMHPQTNAHAGSRYLADLLRLFDGDTELALAAYNAGEGAVLKCGRRIPPYPETQRYVAKVMELYRGWNDVLSTDGQSQKDRNE